MPEKQMRLMENVSGRIQESTIALSRVILRPFSSMERLALFQQECALL